MTRHHLPAAGPDLADLALTLKRSPRARRISLRVSAIDGQVTLTVPPGVPDRVALDFAAQKADWLRRNVARFDAAQPVAPGGVLPVEGQPFQITRGDGRRIRIEDGQLIVPGNPAQIGARLQAWLKTRARDRLSLASDHYATALGRSYTRLTLRDTRSRWGSCTSDGGLMYSWRLIMAPPEVLDYVAAHEVAHLAEMNHSPAFWAIVHRLYGDHRAARGWLRQNGAALHRHVF